MTTQTTQKLPKAAITRALNRAQLAEFTTRQFGTDVLVTFWRSDRAAIERALDVHGFAYDICSVHFSKPSITQWTIGESHDISSIGAGLKVCRVHLGCDDITNSHMTLIVSQVGA